ncbi:pre-mRNA-processing protein 40C isoform X2 [Quercus robur]|uniref:pre-mRNA-processing protein 40C isoform X2 n=1 Tax=Quercus robur TaxID=38942 RepID=UPI002163AB21|nr:pre-mRNA-processing protein 40C isoform X2 [Quercus robur]
MASPAWLTQEMQPPTSQAPVSGLPIGVPSSSGPSTPIAAASAPGAGTPGLMQGPAQARYANAPPGFVIPAPSFSYGVLPNVPTPSGSLQQSASSSAVNSNSPASPLVVQPLVPGPSSSASPSFSYNISQSSIAYPSIQQFQTSTNTSSAVSQEAGNLTSAPAISQSFSLPADSSSSSTITVSSTLSQATSWMPSAPSFSIPPGMPGTPGTPGPPGIAMSAPISSSTLQASAMDSSSSAVPRPLMPTAPVVSNSAVQPQICTPYAPFPAMAPPQGLWLQPPQMGGIPRLPFLPYPAAFPGPFPLPAHGMPLPSVPLPDSQPPGVTPVGTATATAASSAPDHLMSGTLGMQTELPPPDIRKHVEEVQIPDGAAVDEQLDAWTAHKTETGAVYYYNALTGQSTYDKPLGFMGELGKVHVQPTPASTVNIFGTDWVMVTTSDGKKYYHNNKTKISSWQIPNEVTELKKKQDRDTLKEHSILSTQTNLSTEKESAPISLNAPAINTGGRDALALKASVVPGSSSALDLIKKKLQDSGTPVTSSPGPTPSGTAASELNGSRAVDTMAKGLQSENSREKVKDANGDGNMTESSSDSEDADSGPTKEECVIQFKEMLKERGVAPFSKWEKELPKIVFDPRFKAIPSYSARRSLFEHYVKTRAEEERKEKRAAQKAAIEGFKQLLDEVSEDIDHSTDYQTFRKKWGNDPRFEALDRKDREHLLNERVLPLKRAAEAKAQALRAASTSSFKSMLREKGDITLHSRWSKVKDSLRNDPRYKSVKHEDREFLFNEYISELRAAEEESEREAKSKREEQEKLKEREREFRKRKEREEQEMERVRLKVRRKEAVSSFQALLVETIKDPLASWTESKPKLEKDPQARATNPDLDVSDTEKLFREHIKMLNERCAQEFRSLLAEVLTAEASAQDTENGKTVLNSWSTAKRLLKPDPRYNKIPRKEKEVLWRRYADEMLRKQKLALDQKEEKHVELKSRSSVDSGRFLSGSRTYERR